MILTQYYVAAEWWQIVKILLSLCSGKHLKCGR